MESIDMIAKEVEKVKPQDNSNVDKLGEKLQEIQTQLADLQKMYVELVTQKDEKEVEVKVEEKEDVEEDGEK